MFWTVGTRDLPHRIPVSLPSSSDSGSDASPAHPASSRASPTAPTSPFHPRTFAPPSLLTPSDDRLRNHQRATPVVRHPVLQWAPWSRAGPAAGRPGGRPSKERQRPPAQSPGGLFASSHGTHRSEAVKPLHGHPGLSACTRVDVSHGCQRPLTTKPTSSSAAPASWLGLASPLLARSPVESSAPGAWRTGRSPRSPCSDTDLRAWSPRRTSVASPRPLPLTRREHPLHGAGISEGPGGRTGTHWKRKGALRRPRRASRSGIPCDSPTSGRSQPPKGHGSTRSSSRKTVARW